MQDLIGWIGAGIAVIAALAAVWQAWEARQARVQARAAKDDAESAASRIAAAFEELNARSRADAERYKSPWRIERTPIKTGAKWLVILGGVEPVSGIEWYFDREGEVQSMDGDLPADMVPGDAVQLVWWRSMASPSSVKLELSWDRPNGERHTERHTFTM